MRRSYRDDPETGSFEGERVFGGGPAELRYVLHETPGSDALLVVFAAMHPPDSRPRYYFHRTLREVPCHRLFVLDDHGPDAPLRRFSFYLGRGRASDVPEAVCELMAASAGELGVERRRVVTCGASKGGHAALLFGARAGAGHVLAGEPPVHAGWHLLREEHGEIGRYVAGGDTDADREWLDSLLYEAFSAAADPPVVHLYSGRGSPYLERDVMPLVRHLEAEGVEVDLELGDHDQHVPDLGANFPAYVTRKMAELV